MTTGTQVLESTGDVDQPSSGQSRLQCLTWVEDKWEATIDHLIPYGYEDAAGFHYGKEPILNDASHH